MNISYTMIWQLSALIQWYTYINNEYIICHYMIILCAHHYDIPMSIMNISNAMIWWLSALVTMIYLCQQWIYHTSYDNSLHSLLWHTYTNNEYIICHDMITLCTHYYDIPIPIMNISYSMIWWLSAIITTIYMYQWLIYCMTWYDNDLRS